MPAWGLPHPALAQASRLEPRLPKVSAKLGLWEREAADRQDGVLSKQLCSRSHAVRGLVLAEDLRSGRACWPVHHMPPPGCPPAPERAPTSPLGPSSRVTQPGLTWKRTGSWPEFKGRLFCVPQPPSLQICKWHRCVRRGGAGCREGWRAQGAHRELAPRPQAHARREAVQAHREAVLQLPQRETRQVRCLLPRLVEDAHEFLPAAHRNDLQVAAGGQEGEAVLPTRPAERRLPTPACARSPQPRTHVRVVGLRHFAPAGPSRGRHLLTWGKPFQGGLSWGLSVGMSCPDARLNWLGTASRARG